MDPAGCSDSLLLSRSSGAAHQRIDRSVDRQHRSLCHGQERQSRDGPALLRDLSGWTKESTTETQRAPRGTERVVDPVTSVPLCALCVSVVRSQVRQVFDGKFQISLGRIRFFLSRARTRAQTRTRTRTRARARLLTLEFSSAAPEAQSDGTTFALLDHCVCSDSISRCGVRRRFCGAPFQARGDVRFFAERDRCLGRGAGDHFPDRCALSRWRRNDDRAAGSELDAPRDRGAHAERERGTLS